MPPASVALGAESMAVTTLIGVVASVVNNHKKSGKQTFHITDMNVGDGHIVSRVVGEYRSQCGASARDVEISGFDSDPNHFEQAGLALTENGITAASLHHMDVTSTPGSSLRNRIECAAGVDLVLYPHAAYPAKLQSNKLPRMIDRLGDMALREGAIVTLHNHGPADVDEIRKHALGIPSHSVAGVLCKTQERLEQGFQQRDGLYSFSVTVPNTIELPANMEAVEAIFTGESDHLTGKDAEDVGVIRDTLAKLAGSHGQLQDIIEGMDGEQQGRALHYFQKRIRDAGGNDLPITVGGGQMVMAFKSPEIAREAFKAINQMCQQLSPPAIALPISPTIMPEFDKAGAHEDWVGKLHEAGICPPKVHQMATVQQRY
jgi:hypothetical protein